MTPTRNIYRTTTGYRVRCYRRHQKTLVATFPTLRMAKTALRRHEATFPAGKPWSHTPRKARPRTTAVIRADRLDAGLCACCGVDPHRPGRASCVACAAVVAGKTHDKFCCQQGRVGV